LTLGKPLDRTFILPIWPSAVSSPIETRPVQALPYIDDGLLSHPYSEL